MEKDREGLGERDWEIQRPLFVVRQWLFKTKISILRL